MSSMVLARRLPRIAVLAGIATLTGLAAAAQQPSPPQPRRIISLPTIEWDKDGVAWRYAHQQSGSDLELVMSGLRFGLIPEEAGQHLPNPTNALHWSDLPVASEFGDEVRYLWMPMQAAGRLRAPVTSCFGAPSYLVLLFTRNGLFRISWRFLPDHACADVRAAADEVYGAYTPLASTIAVTARYRTGFAEVLDVTDPRAGLLINQRWTMQGR